MVYSTVIMQFAIYGLFAPYFTHFCNDLLWVVCYAVPIYILRYVACVVFIHMYEIGVNVILWLSFSRQSCIMCTMCGMGIVILQLHHCVTFLCLLLFICVWELLLSIPLRLVHIMHILDLEVYCLQLCVLIFFSLLSEIRTLLISTSVRTDSRKFISHSIAYTLCCVDTLLYTRTIC
jgi:hypothetical protein